MTEYPKELQKKVTLLQHFRSYLEAEAKGKAEEVVAEDKKPAQLVYVKKWMRTHHAIMFRLSNKIVQVNFKDHTEIILNSESREVTYVNKKSERLTYPLSTASDSANPEMAKRLKYTKEILTHMLSGGANPPGIETYKQSNIEGETGDKKLAKPFTGEAGEKAAVVHTAKTAGSKVKI